MEMLTIFVSFHIHAPQAVTFLLAEKVLFYKILKNNIKKV